MSSAVALRPNDPAPRGQSPGASQELSLFDGTGGEPTLDELLAGVWEGLTARRGVTCPVCGEQMAPELSAQSRPLGGHCGTCGASLS